MKLPDAFLKRPFAHRGLHDIKAGRAENSYRSFAAAIAAGYGIELDLQLSRDGVPMVFHDYDLGRLTAVKGAVAQHTAKELRAIPLLHDGEGIPTLAEVLALVRGRVPLLVEIKDQDGRMGSKIGPMGADAAHVLRSYYGPLAVMSFNPHAIAEMHHLLPNVPRGIVTDPYTAADWPTLPQKRREELSAISDYARTGSCFVSHNVADLAAPRIAALKQGGAAILCWTVKSKETEDRARKIADNITFEGYLA